MISLKELFNVRKGDVVSIVGSGGKTSLMFKLALELKKDYRVLVTTSTNIIKPFPDEYNYLYTNIDSYLNSIKSDKNGVTIISNGVNEKTNKLIGINDSDLNLLIRYFDIVILEADGSKGLPIKGWKSNEPPVLEKTNKTIGVLPADFINKKAEKDFIYGFEEFNKLTDKSQYINFETISKICSDKDGIFKNSKGSLHLFFNKAENNAEIELTRKLIRHLKEFVVNKPFSFKVCFGSLKTGIYYEY